MKQIFTSMKLCLTMFALAFGANVMAESLTWNAAEQSYANGQAIESIELGEGITATLGNGSNRNKPAYYNAGSALRIYGGNTMTIDAGSLTLTSIKFSFASGEGTNAITVDAGSFASDVWEGAEHSVTFTVSGTSGHRRIASLTITYQSGGDVVYVARPTFNPEGGTFTEPQTVTITVQDGLKAYYSTDGENFTLYSTPLNITSTTTVSAYAQNSEGQTSMVVKETYTIVNLDNLTGTGSSENPYTVADLNALFAVNNIPEGKIFAKGKVSQIKSLDVSKYTRAQYYISDDGTTTDQFYVYNGRYLDNADFTSNDQIKTGDDVVIYGQVVLFGSVPEFAADNYIVSLNGEGGGTVEVKTFEGLAAAKAGATTTPVEALVKFNNVLVTYINKTSVYVTDGTDGFLIYGLFKAGERDVQVGDKISGQITGTLSLYHALPELKPTTAEVTLVSESNAVNAEEVELGDIISEPLSYSSKLVKVADIVFTESSLTDKQVTISSYGEEAIFYDQFGVATGITFDTDAEDYEFTAIVSVRDESVQLYPVNADELKRDVVVETPTYATISEIVGAATADKVESIFQISNLLVSYVNGRSVYVTDGRNGFLLYASAATTLKTGDRISGNVKGNLYLRYGVPQLEYTVADNEITVLSSNNDITPVEVELSSLKSNPTPYISMIVRLNPVVFTAATLESKNVTIMQEGDELILRDNFNILTDIEFDTTKEYDLTTIVAIYERETETTIQVYPVDRSQFVNEVYVFDGDGTEANPYSVADARYLYLNNLQSEESVWVKGIIIGCANGSIKDDKIARSANDEANLVNSNILIADNATETDVNKYLPVNLPVSTELREKLNVKENSANFGKEVLLFGTVSSYFNTAGIRPLEGAVLDGESLGINGVAMDAKKLDGTIYTIGGQKATSLTSGHIYIIGGKKVLVK